MFTTKNVAMTRSSMLTTIESLVFNKDTRTIEAHCTDGTRRLCRIDRCESIDNARALWSNLVIMKNTDTPVSFHAAGGNDPRKWFFAVTAA